MKKIYVLSAFTLLTAGLLTQPVKPVNEVTQELSFEEAALDYNNETGLKLENKNASVGVGEYDVSPTFVQFGMINEDGKDLYVMRFATAVKGNINSLTYTRAAIENVSAEVNKEVKTLYSGISAGASTYYYDASTKEVSTDESLKGEYYWACYTVKYVNGANFNTDLSLSFKVNGEEVNKEVTSFNAEYSKVEDGSEAYPYLISTSEEWDEHVKEVNAIEPVLDSDNKVKDTRYDSGVYYKLVSNITQYDKMGRDDQFFSGDFDGNGYSITTNMVKDAETVGLFGRISSSGSVRNLTVKGSFKATNAALFNGAISPASYGLIDNCVNEATFDLSNNSLTKELDAGGIVGFAEGEGVHNCINKAELKSTSKRLGGIVGRLSSGKMTNCINYGNISAYGAVGGILSVEYDTSIGTKDNVTGESSLVQNCINYGDVTSIDVYVGGIVSYSRDTSSVGVIKSEFRNCVNYGTIIGKGNLAGIIGYGSNTNSQLYDCINRGDVIGTSDSLGHIGGIVGMLGSNNNMTNCENYGQVSGQVGSKAGLGGIAGSTYSNTIITNCKTVVIDGIAEDVLICKDKSASTNKGQFIGFYNSTSTKVNDCSLIKE